MTLRCLSRVPVCLSRSLYPLPTSILVLVGKHSVLAMASPSVDLARPFRHVRSGPLPGPRGREHRDMYVAVAVAVAVGVGGFVQYSFPSVYCVKFLCGACALVQPKS
jgi:hypothetical protein